MTRTPPQAARAQPRKRIKAPHSPAYWREQQRALTLDETALYLERGISPARPCRCTPTSNPEGCCICSRDVRFACWCHGEHEALSFAGVARGAIGTLGSVDYEEGREEDPLTAACVPARADTRSEARA